MLPDQQYNYDVLAIGAHPDDVEHCIGGTLLHLGDQGKSICIAHMTHGESGTYGSRNKRDEEAQAAAKYLKADVRWLDFEDTKIEDNLDARLRMIKFIREIRPRLIMCQYYDYAMMHHDHEATGQIVRNSFRMCRFRNIDTGNEPFWIPNIAYYLLPHHVRPTFVIDVTAIHERWIEMANLYDSQLDAIPGYKDRLISHKHAAGNLIDVPLAEPFYCDRPLIGNDVDILQM